MESLIGRDIGKYHIVEQLGTGGMAVVYKAFDTSLERYVAIKFIRRETIGEQFYPDLLKRFAREAKVLAGLRHPSIVTIYESGDYAGSPFLVMEFIPCGALHPAGKIIPYQQAARLLLPVARALEYAHRRGVIHRDLKPSNILIGEDGAPTLSDFGIAKILDGSEGGGDSALSHLTSTGLAIGTPEYMAPEQWQGAPTAQSDIYGLGIVFYELVTGRRPYTADTPAAVMIKQVTEPLPRPLSYVPDLPEEVEAVIFKTLALRQENRYASMGEFANALEKMVESTLPTLSPSAQTAVDSHLPNPAAPPAVVAVSASPPSPVPPPPVFPAVPANAPATATLTTPPQPQVTIPLTKTPVPSSASPSAHKPTPIPPPNSTRTAAPPQTPIPAAANRPSRPKNRTRWWIGGAIGLMVLVSICIIGVLSAIAASSARRATSTPTQTSTPEMTATAVTPTATTSATATETPIPTATETIVPSATDAPTAAMTATPVPTTAPSATFTPVPFRPTSTPTKKPQATLAPPVATTAAPIIVATATPPPIATPTIRSTPTP
jgi:serine/threonine-protein kinase